VVYGIEFVGGGQVADVVVTFVGEMTVEATSSWLSELVGDDRWRPGMRVLVDYTMAIPAAFSGGDVNAVATGVTFDDERWGSGMFAVVTENPAVHGLARQWQEATKSMGLRTDAFRSRDEAIAWLAGPRDS
jgi:hypothetical protein